MAVRIKPVKFEEATPQQREVLERVRSALGKVPGLYATFGQAPDVLAAVLQFQGALGKGGLTARDRDLVDLHVSQLNGCASPGVALAAVTGALCTGIGYAVWYAALRGLTRTRAAVVQFVKPAMASLGAALLLGEAVSLRLVVSGVVIFAGVGLALLAGW